MPQEHQDVNLELFSEPLECQRSMDALDQQPLVPEFRWCAARMACDRARDGHERHSPALQEPSPARRLYGPEYLGREAQPKAPGCAVKYP